MSRALSILLPGMLGIPLTDTGTRIGRSRATVARLQTQFHTEQLCSQMYGKKWGGRPCVYLMWEEEEVLLTSLFHEAPRGGILVVTDVKLAFEEKVGHQVAESIVYRCVARHGWRKRVPGPRHPNADRAVREEFKKTPKSKEYVNTSLRLPGVENCD